MPNTKTMADVLRLEAKALEKAATLLDNTGEYQVNRLADLFQELRETDSALLFCGVGKSGIIAQKCASTFTSLGLPSFYLHPTEALHGDLGRLRKSDAIVFLSKSGTTEEILKLLPFIETKKSHRIGLIGASSSPIGDQCGIVFDCSVDKEACINNQAPTTSSTLALAMGDAMAVLLESLTGLSKEGFAVNHPGGILGKSLRMKVKDLMIKASSCPVVSSEHTLQEVILLMTKLPVGGCAVVDNGVFKGILVEGDIRRTFTRDNLGLKTKVSDIMNARPTSIGPDNLAYDALEKMESKRSLEILPVLENEKFLGFIRLHELLKEGFSLKT
ncbi:MAG: KpsF/GutQ family sugar-phosphate isomerase [Bacteriovorax sp.]|jgi:arabinose-5-phosphate isomerase